MHAFYRAKYFPLLLAAAIAAGIFLWLSATRQTPNVTPSRLVTAVFLSMMGMGEILLGLLSLRDARKKLRDELTTPPRLLVTEGVYETTRNPICLGMLLLLLAIVRCFDSYWIWIGPLSFYLIIDRMHILPEERALSEEFGDAYIKYKTRVRRWL